MSRTETMLDSKPGGCAEVTWLTKSRLHQPKNVKNAMCGGAVRWKDRTKAGKWDLGLSNCICEEWVPSR